MPVIKFDQSLFGRDFSTPLGNSDLPRHRWYQFKEAFSEDLVKEAISSFPSKKKLSILDPFAGSGTTLISAGRFGHNATGIEVNPFAVFTCKAKSVAGGWKEKPFKKYLSDVLNASKNEMVSPLEDISTFTERPQLERWLFNKSVLRGFTAIDSCLNKTSVYYRPLRLALISSLGDCGNFKRDGKCVRYVKGWQSNGLTSKELRLKFLEKAEMVFEDVQKQFLQDGVKVIQGDARLALLQMKRQKFDVIVTSPPYLNSFDYSDVYRPELFAGEFVQTNTDLRKIRLKTIRSHVQVDWTSATVCPTPLLSPILEKLCSSNNLWSKKIPDMVLSYFDDMKTILTNTLPLVSKNGKAWIVVGTSSYAGVEIPVDLLIADIASRVGWKFKDIHVLRGIRGSGQQWAGKSPRTVSPLRESIVVLEK